jgi:hypothetical protein
LLEGVHNLLGTGQLFALRDKKSNRDQLELMSVIVVCHGSSNKSEAGTPCVYVCMCMCVTEREREKERELTLSLGRRRGK